MAKDNRELMEQPAETGTVTMPNIMAGADFGNINQGSVLIESSRAVAEAQGKLVIAKRFPRDTVMAFTRIMEACRRPDLAAKAFYSFPRSGGTVRGPTIRFAEELARCWGNIDYGIKELSQDDGKSEMQAYAWDLETNTISTQNFANPHSREKSGKMERLTLQRDIYENNANMAARRLRSRLLAILPSDLVAAAVAECENTIKTGGGKRPLIDMIKTLTVSLSKIGVPVEMLEARLGKPVDQMTGEEYAEYVGVYNGIKDGNTRISDWFESPKEANDLTNKVKEAEGIT